ncbi:ABC transporter ATP-binding protein [Nocardia sp. NPDC101769]|uniref:ABC transporter ATP-binding protein n=1 Tax=Nocardia sp. NPDC101769 TaxID=3364333 RepID=UPI00380DE732
MTVLQDSGADRESAPLLQLADVVKSYRIGGEQVRALDGISLEPTGGQFVSIVGPSGAGKSSLLHILGALDTPDSGSIRYVGREIGDFDDNARARFRRREVGFVFQFFNLMPTLSAWENVAIPTMLDGVPLRTAKVRALALLDRVGLGHRARHRPNELSGGQMQRVAIARALLMEPRLILADEPTGNLDSKTGTSIMELLTDVAHDEHTSRSVVMVTHNYEAALSTDRIIRLADGMLGSDEPTASAIAKAGK